MMRNFNINGLRIVVEQTGEGPDDYTIPYVGRDGAKAQAAIDAQCPNWRMMFRPMSGTCRNRPVSATVDSAATTVVEAPVEPVAPETPVEAPKPESPKSKKSKAQ